MASKAPVIAQKVPQAQSLHIGSNEVSAAAYSGWSGPLEACEFHANDMAAIAKLKALCFAFHCAPMAGVLCSCCA